jgi:hypothetical protein
VLVVARWLFIPMQGYTVNLTVIIHYDTLSHYPGIASKVLKKEAVLARHNNLDLPYSKRQLP